MSASSESKISTSHETHRSSSSNQRSSKSGDSRQHGSQQLPPSVSRSSKSQSSKQYESQHSSFSSQHPSSFISTTSKPHSSQQQKSQCLSSSSQHLSSSMSASPESKISTPHETHRSSSSNQRSSKPGDSRQHGSQQLPPSVSRSSKSQSSKQSGSQHSSSSSQHSSSFISTTSKPHSSRQHGSQRLSSSSQRLSSSMSGSSESQSLKQHGNQHSSSSSQRLSPSISTTSKSHSSKQHESRSSRHPSSSRSASSKPPKLMQQGSQGSSFSSHRPSSTKVDNTEDTGIEKKHTVLLAGIHKHALTSMPAGAPYSCDGCKERGCGRSYRCEEKNCSGCVLHEECANAVLHRKNHVSHSLFEGQEFWFLEKPLGYPRVCDACRMDVRGFVYHRRATKDVYDTGLDLHPCCLKLRDKICYKDSGATKTLTLQRNVPKKCVQCKRQKVGDDIKVKGWSYLTSDGDCFHVSCFKELFLEILSDYISEKKVVVSKMQRNVVEKSNMKVVEVVEGSNNSKGSSSAVAMKMVGKIAPVVLKIFSAIFGDPVSFVLALLVEAIAAYFNN